MVAYVILPGIDGSDERHWQTMWEQEWGTAAVRIAPASWSAPDLDDWVRAAQAAYDEASRRDDRVVLVAHSLGCWVAAEWLSPATPVAGAFLVAPPDPRGPGFPRERLATFTDLTAQPLSCPATVVGSLNDTYCTPEAAATFATDWNATLHVTGPHDPHGHLNSDSALGSWQQGRDLLATLNT